MVFLNVPMMQQPEAYVGGAANLFDDTGAITNEGTQKFFETFIDRLLGVDRTSTWRSKRLQPHPNAA